jgi:hypothetical protein
VDKATWFSKIQFIPHPNHENAAFTISVILFREKFFILALKKTEQ